MELADELERLRYENGLSYRKLADICRLNQHTMRSALIRNEYEDASTCWLTRWVQTLTSCA